MYQRIFVPVDHSDTSNLALAEAVKIAKNMGSTLILAHSVDLPIYGTGNPEELDSARMDEPLMNAGMEILQAAAACARKGGLTPELLNLPNWGDPVATVLLDAAHKAGAELIVMGTHGRTGLMHLLMGSVAEGLLRTADIPLLLIRSEIAKG